MKSITIREFERILEEKESNDLHIIDVREKDAFQLAHIEGVHNIPLDELQGRLKDLNKEEEYHIVCYSGSFSKIAADFLLSNGFRVVNVQSGMNAYSGSTVSSNVS